MKGILLMQYIDAVCVKGERKVFSCSIEVTDTGTVFNPLDLTDYNVRFRVLGSPTADAKVLVEHIITQVSDLESIGQITNAAAGEFAFTISAEETNQLGCGAFPISVELIGVDKVTNVHTLTEGSYSGEFSKIRIVQV